MCIRLCASTIVLLSNFIVCASQTIYAWSSKNNKKRCLTVRPTINQLLYCKLKCYNRIQWKTKKKVLTYWLRCLFLNFEIFMTRIHFVAVYKFKVNLFLTGEEVWNEHWTSSEGTGAEKIRFPETLPQFPLARTDYSVNTVLNSNIHCMGLSRFLEPELHCTCKSVLEMSL